MGRQVARWIADDGKEFNDQKEMLLYEMSLIDSKEIEAFLKIKAPGGGRRVTEYTKLLIEWQAYMRENNTSAAPVVVHASKEEHQHEVEEWIPKDGYLLDDVEGEDDDIEKSFERATKI